MSYASHKMGFWSVFALVTGSQIGSGAFMLPATLAAFGPYGLVGWLISGLGAVALALVFAQLCTWFPKTGGPHVYVEEAFGKSAAFFTGWTYWVISWISTTVVVIAIVGYIMPFVGIESPVVIVPLEIALIIAVTLLNFRGVALAGYVEFILTVLKVVPLCIIPALALLYFNRGNFVIDSTVAVLPLSTILRRVTLLTMWGFIGLECATTPAESVENPTKTIPRAIVLGTICVAILYMINSIAIMGVIPGAQLMFSNAPYADATRAIFGGNWYLVIAAIASMICIGTLNAWTLTSGQIVLGLAKDGLLPAFFGYKNKYDAPYWGLAISCLGVIPLLILTANKSLATQILSIIDFSVTAFLFVYAICCLAFFKVLFAKKESVSSLILSSIYGLVALLFCVWVIYETPLVIIGIVSLFALSGLPFYCYFLATHKR